MLVRAAGAGFAVYLARRSTQSRFMPGVYVFPGGAVDAADRDEAAFERIFGTVRGIGFEYADLAGRLYALAEWPANGGTLAHFSPLGAQEPGCPDARTFSRGTRPNGIVWSTTRGLIMSLQADGANDARTLELEWRKLIRRGVCR